MSTSAERIMRKVKQMNIDAAELERLRAVNGQLLAALEAISQRHSELVGSGDCGFWDVETEPAMIQARAAIAEAQKATGGQ